MIKLISFLILSLQIINTVEAGLLASYSFEDNFTDSVGNYNPVESTVNFAEGKIGRAIEFDRSNEYISFPYDFLEESESLTVSLWVYPKTVGNIYQIVLWEGNKEGDGFGPENEAHLSIDYKAKEAQFWMKGKYRDLVVKGNISKDEWNHIAIVLKDLGSTEPLAKIYIDGNMTDIKKIKSALARNYTKPMQIGSPNNRKYPFSGKIDELRIYEEVLTDSQIAGLLREGIACLSDENCGTNSTVNYCWGNFLCTNKTSPLCLNQGKNSRCELEEKTSCAPCEYGCEEASCIIKELEINNAEIKTNKINEGYSFFRKLKCKLFHPFNDGQYSLCLQTP